MALKYVRIIDFCNTISRFADLEKNTDCRLAENFGLDSGLWCLSPPRYINEYQQNNAGGGGGGGNLAMD